MTLPTSMCILWTRKCLVGREGDRSDVALALDGHSADAVREIRQVARTVRNIGLVILSAEDQHRINSVYSDSLSGRSFVSFIFRPNALVIFGVQPPELHASQPPGTRTTDEQPATVLICWLAVINCMATAPCTSYFWFILLVWYAFCYCRVCVCVYIAYRGRYLGLCIAELATERSPLVILFYSAFLQTRCHSS